MLLGVRYPTIDCGNNLNLGITSRCKNNCTDSSVPKKSSDESKTHQDQQQVHKGVHLFAGWLEAESVLDK